MVIPIGCPCLEIHGERVLSNTAELEDDHAVGVFQLEVLDRRNRHPALKIHYIRVLLPNHGRSTVIQMDPTRASSTDRTG